MVAEKLQGCKKVANQATTYFETGVSSLSVYVFNHQVAEKWLQLSKSLPIYKKSHHFFLST